jgi:hypothetical protein
MKNSVDSSIPFTDYIPFIIAAIFVFFIALSNWMPKANADVSFPPVCKMFPAGDSMPGIVTVPAAKQTECLEEMGDILDANNNPIPPISAQLATLPVSTLQAIYAKITGKQDTNTDSVSISEDIMAAVLSSPHGADIPEIGMNITGTYPNLIVSF